jgi:hypothetical protein
MACFKCRHTGAVVCDADEAEIMCEVCGRCAAERKAEDGKQTG